MPGILDSLFVRLGFQVDASGLEGFAAKTQEAKNMALGLGAALAGAVYGIEHMVHGAVERMGGIQNFAEQMGLSARSVDALGRVARENESSLEAMEGALRSMTMMAGQAAQGIGRGRMLFKKFGIDVKDANGHVKTTEELLGDVADKLQKLPSLAQKQALGGRLGFDPAMIKLLSEGRANFNRLREEALKATPFKDSDYEQAELTEKAFRKAGDAVQRLKDRLAIGLLPTVNVLLARFKGWAQDEQNINKIKDAINKVVEVAGFLVKHMKLLIGVFVVMKAHQYGLMIMGWGKSLMSVATHMGKAAGLSSSLALGFKAIQGVLTGGLLAALLLVGEDLYVFYQGGTSVTGWLLTQFPYAVEVAKGALALLSGALVAISTGSGPLGALIVGVGGLIIAGQALRDAWNPLKQWWQELWDSFDDTVANWYNNLPWPARAALGIMSGNTVFSATGSKMATNAGIRTSGDKVKQWIGNNPADLSTETWRKWKDESGPPSWLTPRGAGAAPPLAHGPVDNSIRVGNVYIQESKDPSATWQAIQKAAREQARNGQSGVR